MPDEDVQGHVVHLYDARYANSLMPVGQLLTFGSVRTPISIVAFNTSGSICGVWLNDNKENGTTYLLPSRDFYCSGNGLKKVLMEFIETQQLSEIKVC